MTSGRMPEFCHNMRSSLSRNDDVGFSKSETCSVCVGVLTSFLLGFPGQQLLKNPGETSGTRPRYFKELILCFSWSDVRYFLKLGVHIVIDPKFVVSSVCILAATAPLLICKIF